MMRRMILAMVVALGMEIATAADGDKGTAEPAKGIKLQTTCPVMGGKINKDLHVDHEGKRIYVCCAACIEPLKKEAAKYIAKLEKDGVTLDQTPVADPTKEQAPAAVTVPAKDQGGAAR